MNTFNSNLNDLNEELENNRDNDPIQAFIDDFLNAAIQEIVNKFYAAAEEK